MIGPILCLHFNPSRTSPPFFKNKEKIVIEEKYWLKMGNIFFKLNTQSFPCQTCKRVFKRELSGSLLCPECQLYNKFNHLDFDKKHELVMSCTTFPVYLICRDNCKTNLINSFSKGENWTKSIIEQIKLYMLDPVLEKKYKMIKYIIQFLFRADLIVNNFQGFIIHSNDLGNILFAHHPNITDSDRVLKIDFDKLVERLAQA